MLTKGWGYELLRKNTQPRTKTFMDYEPGHVGDNNYLRTQTNTTLKAQQQ